MLRNAVVLDAAMSVSAAIRRLAEHGYWRDHRDEIPNAFLSAYAERIRVAARKRPGPSAPIVARYGDAKPPRSHSVSFFDGQVHRPLTITLTNDQGPQPVTYIPSEITADPTVREIYLGENFRM